MGSASRTLLGFTAMAAVALGAGSLALASSRSVDSSDNARAVRVAEGLIVETAAPRSKPFDPSAPIDCFVDGVFAGRMTLSACGGRNGAPAGALNVGLESTAYSSGPDIQVQPALRSDAADDRGLNQVALPHDAPLGACERRDGDVWENLPGLMSREDCVVELFAGVCAPDREVLQGRWRGQGLRLEDGRIDAEGPLGGYRTLRRQESDCSLAA